MLIARSAGGNSAKMINFAVVGILKRLLKHNGAASVKSALLNHSISTIAVIKFMDNYLLN
jgi:hypothetical protein